MTVFKLAPVDIVEKLRVWSDLLDVARKLLSQAVSFNVGKVLNTYSSSFQ